MDAQAYIAERTPWVDEALERCLPPADRPPIELHAAMRHLVFPGGKRLRPALAFAGAEAVGADPRRALPMACAVELMHQYSLIHDDLPCMDDDVERRGRPTVHVAYGESTALLAGDALQAAAFEVLAGASVANGVDAERVVRAVSMLSGAVGARGLVGGQVDDLAFSAEASSQGSVESIHLRKTAALIRMATVGGALLGGADDAMVDRLQRYGDAVGVAFQVADDLLDADEDDGCSSIPILGVEGAREMAESLLDTALRELDGLGEQAEPLRELARFAVRRNT